MKRLTMTVFLTALLSPSPADVQAQQFDADWSAIHVDTGFGVPLNDGTRLDHNAAGLNVGNLDVQVTFTWAGKSSVLAHVYISRVEWTVQHSAFSHVASYTTHVPESDHAWSMCRGAIKDSEPGPRPCRAFQTLGSVTINARAIYDGDVVAVVAEDSRAFRVVDTERPIPVIPQPTTAVPRPPSIPYCVGDRDKCNETVNNSGLWRALTGLCPMRPGAELALGDGAYIKCPE